MTFVVVAAIVYAVVVLTVWLALFLTRKRGGPT